MPCRCFGYSPRRGPLENKTLDSDTGGSLEADDRLMVKWLRDVVDLRAQHLATVGGTAQGGGDVRGIIRQENVVDDSRKETAVKIAQDKVDCEVESICLLIRRTSVTALNAALMSCSFPFPSPFASRCLSL